MIVDALTVGCIAVGDKCVPPPVRATPTFPELQGGHAFESRGKAHAATIIKFNVEILTCHMHSRIGSCLVYVLISLALLILYRIVTFSPINSVYIDTRQIVRTVPACAPT